MTFKVSARTVLQLGAELIGSDGIAFYELIKNAYDAGSPLVKIKFCIRADHEILEVARAELGTSYETAPDDDALDIEALRIREDIVESLEEGSPGFEKCRQELIAAGNWGEFRHALDGINTITIADTGSGMSLKTLEDVYLRIGTAFRKNQKEADDTQVITGEKGIGRLSVMRLGWRTRISTSLKKEKKDNCLDIDWRKFSDTSKLIEEVEGIEPTVGNVKECSDEHGTTIEVLALRSVWTKAKTEHLVRMELIRFTDPFSSEKRIPLRVYFNGERLSADKVSKALLEHAAGVGWAQYSCDGRPEFTYVYESKRVGRQPGSLSRDDISQFLEPEIGVATVADRRSLEKLSPGVLKSIGPFKVRYYWFNRKHLKAIDEVGDIKAVRNLVNTWAGGLMVFRDGFRVLPYGSTDDDWLDLDRRALGRSGYKFNTKQIIGVVELTSKLNPNFRDKTNREGFQDAPELTLLIRLMRKMVDDAARCEDQADRRKRAVEPVEHAKKEIKRGREMLKRVKKALSKSSMTPKERVEQGETLSQATKVLKDFEAYAENAFIAEAQERGDLVHLAGIGLMIEFLAHELARSLSLFHATMQSIRSSRVLPGRLKPKFDVLAAQLKTLEKRMRLLDPMSTSGRQSKTEFDLIEWVRLILDAHAEQAARDNVEIIFDVLPESKKQPVWKVKMVKGMVVQIVENLLNNSLYWLRQRRTSEPDSELWVRFVASAELQTIEITDNGQGVGPNDAERIFSKFYTKKPPNVGRGLGLYISQELAEYNNARLYLSEKYSVHSDRYNTFVLEVAPK